MLQQYSKAVYGRVETTWHIEKAGVNVPSATVAHYVARPLVIPATINTQHYFHPNLFRFMLALFMHLLSLCI